MMTKINPAKKKLPGRYGDLDRLMPARAIRDEAEHENMVQMIDQLMRVRRLTRDQQRYVETLLVLVEAYEREHHAIDVSELSGIHALNSALETSGMTTQALAKVLGVSRSHAYNLRKGLRALTVEHIRRLGQYFHVRPELFI